MSDCAINIFQLKSQRGYSVPRLDIHYTEYETGIEWYINCGGSRGYLVRVGETLDDDLDEQSADSHFMIRRVTTSLLLAGAGLFQAEAMGRLIFKNIQGEITWSTHLDHLDPLDDVEPTEVIKRVNDWVQAITKSKILRRAADDAHLALTYPHEALVYVYRGLEWLKIGQSIGWEDIARDIGVSKKEIKQFTKLANKDYGARHAVDTGKKLRASFPNYATWVGALLDAISAARTRNEPNFKPMSPEQVAEAVKRAAPINPYP